MTQTEVKVVKQEIINQPKIETKKRSAKKYYLVVKLVDGTIHLWPGKSISDCQQKGEELMETKWGSRVDDMQYIEQGKVNL